MDDTEITARNNNEKMISELLSKVDNLSAELRKYKSVFSGSLDLIAIIDGHKGTILEVNDAFTNALGYDNTVLRDMHFSELFPAQELQEDSDFVDKVNMFGPVLLCRKIRHSNGSFIPMDITINVINIENSKAVLITLRDASERVKAENAIKKMNEELALLNQTKDKFFSIIAHDIRNPLSGILGLSEMLSSQKYDLSEEETNTITLQINSSAIRLQNLLNNLLDWAWLQTGKITSKPELLKIDRIIEEVFQLMNANAINKNISLNFSQKSGSFIFADCNMIKSVVQNLVSNALKFTPGNGSVDITAKETDGFVKIIVADNGVGISDSQMHKLFKIGEQVSTPGTNKEVGTGLGLLLCKELVEKNRGTISVKSQKGSGTIFTVSLPIAENS